MRTADDFRFRIWNPVEKEFIWIESLDDYDGLIDWDKSQKETDEGNGLVDVRGIEITGWPAEQWTGFKDKTGEDIYDGDIVEHHGLVTVVYWDKGCFCVYEADLLLNHVDRFRVIGNIHQNPELLTPQ